MNGSPVVIVQARMTSTRLPGKVLLPALGRPLLAWQLDRLRQVRNDVRVAVATTTERTDDPIVGLCESMGIPVVRGSEDDVLGRYHLAAEQLRADPIIRVTSDCPLIDPDITRAVLQLYETTGSDYVSNTLERTFPRGLDTEAMSRGALDTAWREASAPFEREHVTPYLYRNPDRFQLTNFRNDFDEGERRWTIDTPADLAFVRAVFDELRPIADSFRTVDVRAALKRRPEIENINRGVAQKALIAESPKGSRPRP